jgi:deoxyribodipyrimidine photolyase
MIDRALAWFRRDLRDFDHAALSHALVDARERRGRARRRAYRNAPRW